MNGQRLAGPRMALVGIAGAAMLIGTAALGEPVQQKWWTPREGRTVDRTHPRVERARPQVERRAFERRYVRQWRGQRVYRDQIIFRDGPRYRAWRYAYRPVYYHPRHIVRVRPVRYWIVGHFDLGPFRVSTHLGDRDHWYYGCNFCDARFGSYRSYHRHVVRCDHRPQGYRILVSNWDAASLEADWYDDHYWHPGDGRDD